MTTTTDPNARLRSGDRLAEFEILSLLGAGGMGDVYLARDTELDRLVAVKLIRPRLLADVRSRERFEREARATARLNHPNIVVLYRMGHSADRPFLVMERLEGEPLSARRHRHLPWRDAVRIVRPVLAALEAAHRAGLVHRDLKPENVFLCRDGRIKVLDFGVAVLGDLAATPAAARQAPSSTIETAPTVDDILLAEAGLAVTDSRLFGTAASTAGVGPMGASRLLRGFIGTPAYMAPEQWRGEPAGPSADLWAVGIMLHEMVGGRRPFDAPTAAELQLAVLGPTPAPRLWAPTADVPDELGALIARLLAKNPADRPAAAAAVAKALDNLVTGTDAEMRGGPSLGESHGSDPVVVQSSTGRLSIPELVAQWDLLHPPILGGAEAGRRGISGRTINESLDYFHRLGGDVSAVVGRLNEKIRARAAEAEFFPLTADVLGTADYTFSHETYFLVTMLLKVVSGEETFHYRDPNGQLLSADHKLFERSPIDVPEVVGERGAMRASVRNAATAYRVLPEATAKAAPPADTPRGRILRDGDDIRTRLLRTANALVLPAGAPLTPHVFEHEDAWLPVEIHTVILDLGKILSNRGDFAGLVGRSNHTRAIAAAANVWPVATAFRNMSAFAGRYTTTARYATGRIERGRAVINALIDPDYHDRFSTHIAAMWSNSCDLSRETMASIPSALYGLEPAEAIETHCFAGRPIPPEHARLAEPLDPAALAESQGRYCQFIFRWRSTLTGWQRLFTPLPLCAAAAGPLAYVALTSSADPFVKALAFSQAASLPLLAGLFQRARRLLRQHRALADQYWTREYGVEQEKTRLAQAEAKLRAMSG